MSDIQSKCESRSLPKTIDTTTYVLSLQIIAPLNILFYILSGRDIHIQNKLVTTLLSMSTTQALILIIKIFFELVQV